MHSRDVVAAPPSEAIQRAAAWLVQMQEGTLSSEEHRLLQAWRQEDPEHEGAWRAAMQLKAMFSSVPNGLGQRVLGRRSMARRDLLLSITAVLALVPVGWLVHREWPAVIADYRTAIGEQQRIVLPDGSQLHINTASLVDVQFDTCERVIRLHRGEIAITTASDKNRPFMVRTPAGVIRALGTRFVVRIQERDITEVAVYAHAVAITPATAQNIIRLEAGKKTTFDDKGIYQLTDHHDAAAAWVNGQLLADNQRLEDFINELARYHFGVLRCDPAVADFRISGVFPVKDTRAVLRVVADTLPVRVSQVTDYWTTVTSR